MIMSEPHYYLVSTAAEHQLDLTDEDTKLIKWKSEIKLISFKFMTLFLFISCILI